MTTVVTRFPVCVDDNPDVWRINEGQWTRCGPLSDFQGDADDLSVMALVSPVDVRCLWSSWPGLEPRQAESVAGLKATEQSLGPVHVVARHVGDDMVVSAAISPEKMASGLALLSAHGLDPDLLLPMGLAVEGDPDHVAKAAFDGMEVFRGSNFVAPDEPAFRQLLIGDGVVKEYDQVEIQAMLWASSRSPLINLRQGKFAKRQHNIWATPTQRQWIIRLLGALVGVTILLGIATFVAYTSGASDENERALAAARKIDPSIQDIALAETQLDRALQQKGIVQRRFGPLSAGLWRAVKMAPNVSVRELRFSPDGILTTVLAAPDAQSLNKALVAVQKDGFKITAVSRRDDSGATLVDLTMRMP
ncbi:MAG: type II secretion system protein GspL [Sphingorhabdus sp.]